MDYEYPRLDFAQGIVGDRTFCSNGSFAASQYHSLDFGKNDHHCSHCFGNCVSARASKSPGAVGIVLERNGPLKEIERTGIEINGLVSSQLLINIFEHNTPLHDGAVVIRGNRVAAATCYLPLSDNMMISKDLGTRHRAAVGISETTDSLTIVVSEETGRVSLVGGGMLQRISDADTLRKALEQMEKQEETGANRFKIWKGIKKNERKAD